MGYFFTDEESSESLSHFGILGQKWRHRNGPPYPLGSGDHSAAEKSAAKAAGVKVGSDSGKGSIENVKKSKSSSSSSKSPKKEMTEEEKRQAALDAAMSGDKKKIAKYMDYLSTEELRAANERARYRDELTKKDPNAPKRKTKEEQEKEDAMRSGDKEKIKEVADKLSNQELIDALNRVDLNAKLNYKPPEKTTMDKIDDAMKVVSKVRDWTEKGLEAYNTIAKIHNAVAKDDDAKWPIVGDKKKSDGGDKKEVANSEKKDAVKQFVKDVKDNTFETKEMDKLKLQKQKMENERYEMELQQKKDEIKKQQKEEKQAEKEAKKEAKEAKKQQKEEESEDSKDMIMKDVDNYFQERQIKRAAELGWTLEEYADAQFLPEQVTKTYWDNNWVSAAEASVGGREISDNLTPAEQEYLDSFKNK